MQNPPVELDTTTRSDISLFDIVVAYSYARDLYDVCHALHPETDLFEFAGFKILKEEQGKLVHIIIDYFCNNLIKKVTETATKLSKHGIGEALAIVGTILQNLLRCKRS